MTRAVRPRFGDVRPDETALDTALAAVLLFGAESTDRALWGWHGVECLHEELKELGLRDRIA